jgi:hypothetical protein
VGPCDIGAISFREEDDHQDEEDVTAALQGVPVIGTTVGQLRRSPGIWEVCR